MGPKSNVDLQDVLENLEEELRDLADDIKTTASVGAASVQDTTQAPMFRARLSRIDATHDKFMTTLLEIKGLLRKLGKPIDTHKALQSQTRSSFYEALSYETPLSSSKNKSEIEKSILDRSMVDTNTHFRLPPINIPSFSGDISSWPSFKDTFVSLVHLNENFSDVQKFHYLKSALKGTAIQTISAIEISEAGYAQAWESLNKRFDSPRILATNHLMKILNFKPLTKNNLASLEHFSAIVIESATSFIKLNLDDPSGFILSTLALRLLDPQTRQYYEMDHRSNANLPSWEEFTDFIQQRIIQLQSTALITDSTNVYNSSSLNSKSQKPAKQVLLSSEPSINSIQCPVCNGRHKIYECSQFQSLNPKERFERIKRAKRCLNCFASGHIVVSCPSHNSCGYCQKRHHSLLHFTNFQNTTVSNRHKRGSNKPNSTHSTPKVQQQPRQSKSPVCRTQTSEGSKESSTSPEVQGGITSLSSTGQTNVLLATAIARIQDSFGEFHNIRLLVDSGSQRSFITKECVRKLALPICHNPQHLVGFGNQAITGGKHQVECILIPRKSRTPEIITTAVIIDRICANMPTGTVPNDVIEHFVPLDLADSSFHRSSPIDFLAGADLFGSIVTGEVKSMEGFPNAISTIFGWILLGPIQSNIPSQPTTTLLTSSDCTSNPGKLYNLMKTFWEIEEVANTSRIDPEDAKCESHFLETHSRDKTGRYMVRLPFKSDPDKLGESRFSALHRFKKLEQRLDQNPELKSEYSNVLLEYWERNYMAPTANPGKHYLPHHGVLKDSSSTNLRIVFDASAATTKGSLNDCLLTGPKLQKDIKDVILNFRIPQIALAADICQMYLQIWVAPQDRVYQHFFYRFDSTESVQEFEFQRLMFGMSCSPFLALRVLQQLVSDHGKEYPRASAAILRDMYVDDLLSGADTIGEALELQSELVTLLGKGGFELKKWASNATELVDRMSSGSCNSIISFSNMEDAGVKVLGMHWNPIDDHLAYKVQTGKCIATKRGIMSTIARLFDPLGYLAPVVFRAKCLLQSLWQSQLDWDEPVPPQIAKSWESFYNCLECLSNVRIPRRFFSEFSQINLVGFADASSLGYAAVIYLHVETLSGNCISRLLFAKTRLAPLKTLTIPRMELCAALLLVSSLKALENVICRLGIVSTTLFSDSATVLSWLHTPFHKLKPFVANRVAKVLEMSELTDWHHVRSAENAADVASRGIDPPDIVNHTVWWHGPAWLEHPKSNWPIGGPMEPIDPCDLPEIKGTITVLSNNTIESNFDEVLQKFSSFSKLIRVFSYVLRFVTNARLGAKSAIKGPLILSEIRFTTITVLKLVQRNHDLAPLNQSNITSIRSLSPFVDSSGLVRVGGRLHTAPLDHDAKHPILLPNKCHVVNLLVDHLHVIYLHAGPQLLQSVIRQRYWIISSRRLVRSRIHNCVRCHRLRVKGVCPIMGNLPLSRFEQGRPFINTGVDFAGPFLIKESQRRKAALGKVYICLFVCFSTKAVHIEVVSQLSTDAFLACLDRFIARRGLPSKIFSDNGSNFIGASRYLKELYAWWKAQSTQDHIRQFLLSKEIEWTFIPPLSPHFGGLWESGIKSLKFHLVRILDSQPLTFEELTTISSRVEAILNSRPLHPLSSSPDDYEVLTPGHFLIGAPLCTVPEHDLTDLPRNRLSRWQFLQQCISNFWKRWRLDYLHCLQQKGKWTKSSDSLRVGSLVLLREPNTSPLQWPTGRILEVFPGQDGVVRVAKVKTNNGDFLRSVSRLSPLHPEEI